MLDSSLVLAFLALLPAIALLIYIYKMDRVEKEPKGLLIGLLFAGVGSVIPTVLFEMLAGSLLNTAFVGKFAYGTASLYPGSAANFVYTMIDNFICVALVEEFFKWMFMFLITRKSKNFDCLFDGVVYSVFVSLGFAAAENLFYVFQYGFANALTRMLTAVPAHCFFGVIMGYFYSKWFLTYKARELEQHLRDNMVIPAGEPGFKSGGLLALSILLPAFAHGFYDFCASMESWIYSILFIIFLIGLYIVCFRNVYVLSKQDTYCSLISMDMVLKKHPQAINYVSCIPEFSRFFYNIPPQNPQGYPYDQPQQNPQNYPYNQPPQNPQGYPYNQPQNHQGYPYAQPRNQQNSYPYGHPIQNDRDRRQ